MGRGGKGKGRGRRRPPDNDTKRKWLTEKRGGGQSPGQLDSHEDVEGEPPTATSVETAFRSFYEAQRFFGDGPEAAAEFGDFWQVLHTPLPVTVRVDLRRKGAEGTEKELASKGWRRRSEFDRSGMSVWECSNETYTSCEKDQSWTERENRRGTLIFQELVSLVPPLLLAPSSHHRCIDMCAAPGGKSLQLLESMGAGDEVGAGALLSSDKDPHRCCLVLWRMLAKGASPCSCSCLANAKDFPLLLEMPHEGGDPVRLEYDRILADVPCSGDGTARKNAQVWRGWSPREPLELHSLQKAILLRALYLLAPGGILVYSTCSLNPVENEAVVLTALRRWKRSDEGVELLDAHAAVEQVCGLRTSPGLSTWVVPAPDLFKKDANPTFTCWLDVPDELREPAFGGTGDATASGRRRPVFLRPDLFPGGAEYDPAEDPLRESLRRCVRFFPQHGDTGGFFVAVLRKGSPKGERPVPRPIAQAGEERGNTGTARHPLLHSSFLPVKATDEAWLELKAFYGLDGPWCKEKMDRQVLFWQWMHKDHLGRLALVSDGVARLWAASTSNKKAMHWTRLGVFLFEGLPKGILKGLVPTRWRLTMEGANRMGPLLGRRRVYLDPVDAMTVLLASFRQALTEDLQVDLSRDEGLIAEDGRHICGGVLIGVRNDIEEGLLWIPGALTPRMLRILVDDDEANALADWLRDIARQQRAARGASGSKSSSRDAPLQRACCSSFMQVLRQWACRLCDRDMRHHPAVS